MVVIPTGYVVLKDRLSLLWPFTVTPGQLSYAVAAIIVIFAPHSPGVLSIKIEAGQAIIGF